MRKDMGKVISERGSCGGVGKEMARKNRHQAKEACRQAEFDEDFDIEALDFRGIRKVHTASSCSWDNRKNEDINLTPLRKFLRSCIGKPWNDVFSDLSKTLKPQQMTHINWMVETKTYFEGGKIWVAGIPPREISSGYYRDDFYVDPRDGTLRCVSQKPRSKVNYNERQAKKLNAYRYIDPKSPLVQYHCIGDIWYEIQMKEASAEEKKQKHFGKFVREYNRDLGKVETVWRNVHTNAIMEQLKENLRAADIHWYDRDLWDACKTLFGGPYLPNFKRQISTKEIGRIKDLMEARDKQALRKAA